MDGKHAFVLSLILSWISWATLNLSLANAPEKENAPSDKNDGSAFAVVELFTSEGCSSCPPADAHLSELVAQANKNDLPIFALAFHVDYWDYIGWKDPFADKTYSERQRKYAQAFSSTRIYTPQMIVNGRYEFVGSNRTRAKAYIQTALEQSPKVRIELELLESSPSNALNLSYRVSNAPDDAVLNVVLVERDLVTEVKRGENSGRTLRHDNVVRVFETVDLMKIARGQISLKVSPDVHLEKSSIIGYVQDGSSMEIVGASGFEL